jgi:MFS family permease
MDTNVAIRIKNNRKKLSKKSKVNQLKNDIIIPIKTEYIDITFSCDYIYQYMFENQIISKKFQYITTIFTYLSIFISTLTVAVFFSYILPPYDLYKYTCYDIKTDTFIQCSYRNFCICDTFTDCVIACYDNDDKVCKEKFLSKTKLKSQKLFSSKNFGDQIYIKFTQEGTNLNLFSAIETDYCLSLFYTALILCLFFTGAIIGEITMGLISDRYGKRIPILTSAIFLLIINIVMILRLLLATYSTDVFPYFVFWYIIAFILGFFIYPFKSMMLKMFYENYGDTNYLHGINGLMHSYIGFVNLFYFLFKAVMHTYNYFLVFSVIYYIIFIIVFLTYFTESPRFYSERRDTAEKKKCFEKMLDKLLVIRKTDSGEVEKYYKVFKFYDSNIEKIYHEQVVDRQLDTEEINKFQEERKVYLDTIKKEANIAKRKEFKNKLIKIELLKKEQEKKNSLKSLLYIKNETLQITFKTIWNRFREDGQILTIYPIYFFCWLSIILTHYLIFSSFLLELTDPNSPNYKNINGLLFNIIMNFTMPSLICRLSYYFNPDKIIFICLLIISILCIIEDVRYISPDLERNLFFGTRVEKMSAISNNTFSKTTIQFTIMIVYALFNLNSLTVVPTLYRGTFYSFVQASTHIAAMIAFGTMFILNTPILLIGLISVLNCLLFYLVSVKENEIRLKEYIDAVNAHKQINLKKDNTARINKAQKSIFSKFRHYSSKKFKNKKIE